MIIWIPMILLIYLNIKNILNNWVLFSLFYLLKFIYFSSFIIFKILFITKFILFSKIHNILWKMKHCSYTKKQGMLTT